MDNKKWAQECCPRFNVDKWDKKEFNWKDKAFIKESMPTFFHIPFPPIISKKLMKLWNLAEKDKRMLANKEDVLILFRDPSAFKSEMYFAVSDKVKDADNVVLSGKFVSRVFDGPYNAMPKFMKEMDEYLETRDEKAKDYYVHYAYCPKCLKKYGHNYMILFAKV